MTNDSTNNHPKPRLLVEAGPDKGREIVVPVGVLSLGRSSENDICLVDPILSRHHCQLSYDGVDLIVKDLDSANGTLVNQTDITESKLHLNDIIEIGDTRMRVTDIPGEPQTGKNAPSEKAAEAKNEKTSAKNENETPSIVVDLGFDSPNETNASTAKKPNWRPLLWGIGAVAILLTASSLILRSSGEQTDSTTTHPVEPPSILPLEIKYEKVEASTSTVFRYCMELDMTGRISVEIDDLSENRHVRKEGVVSTNRIERLANQIIQKGYFNLSDSYEGIAPEGVLSTFDITILSNRRAKRVYVANQVEPDVFKDIRETLETFGKNELGIWAIQFSREELVRRAEDAFTRANNAYDQRGIAYGNTYEAIQNFKEASFYLETIEPKPDFFPEIVAGLAKATEELGTAYEQQRFEADRAINLRDWEKAGNHLRIIREMIPDKDDPRHHEAYRKLLDVQSRLQKEKQL